MKNKFTTKYYLLITIIFLFTIQLTAQSSKIIGKWVPVKFEEYAEKKLVETIKFEINTDCLSYHEFTSDNKLINKKFDSFCKLQESDSSKLEFIYNKYSIGQGEEEIVFNFERTDNILKTINYYEEDSYGIFYYREYNFVKNQFGTNKNQEYYKNPSLASYKGKTTITIDDIEKYENSEVYQIIKEINSLLSISSYHKHKSLILKNGYIVHTIENFGESTRSANLMDIDKNKLNIEKDGNNLILNLQCKSNLNCFKQTSKNYTQSFNKIGILLNGSWAKSNSLKLKEKFTELIQINNPVVTKNKKDSEVVYGYGDIFEFINKIEKEKLLESQKKLIEQLAVSKKRSYPAKNLADISTKILNNFDNAIDKSNEYYKNLKDIEKYKKIVPLISSLKEYLILAYENARTIEGNAMTIYDGMMYYELSERKTENKKEELFNEIVTAYNSLIKNERKAKEKLFEIVELEIISSRN